MGRVTCPRESQYLASCGGSCQPVPRRGEGHVFLGCKLLILSLPFSTQGWTDCATEAGEFFLSSSSR
uniref:Uncharacterized protein n=1 Tax=Crocodylus porosus TaxID=8502 RepID=A0A7M4ETM3_CROPO